jgi:oligopeptide transport system substrate-binding protein
LIPAALIAALRALRRRRLHLQAAVALETTHPEAFEALAYQYMEGGEIDKGMTYLVRAGDRARAIYAHQEAINSYQQALEHLKERGVLEQAARTLMKLGLTYHNAFEFHQARQAYQEGFAVWQQVGMVKPGKPPPAAPHALRGLIAEPIALDPALSTTVVSHRILDQLYSGLVELSSELDIVPDVAHSWEVMDGGRRYVFYLRNDVFWSDGIQVTAGDFVAAWQRVLDPLAGLSHAHRLYDIKNAQPFHRGKLEPVDALGVRARDAFTLEVELERPVSTFLHLLSYSLLFPVPQHILRERGDGWVTLDGLVSNGPFQLDAWYPGESLVLKTNPTYHGRSSGNLKRVEMAFRSGVQAEEDLRKYQQDQLDVLFLDDVIGPSGVLRQYANLFADQFLSAPRLATHYLGFDTRRPPLDDPRVRRAFALAIDRDHLFNVVWGGRYFPATGGLVPPGMPGHSAGAALPFDPKKASRLLAEAGYPGGHGFPVVTSARFDDPSNISFTEYLQEQWLEHLGIKVGWDTMSWRVFLDRLGQHQPQMYVMGWSADVPDPGDFLSLASWRRDSGWQNEAYDQLVDRARGIMDQDERMKLYRQAERILIDEVPILPLGYFRLHFLVKPWVRRFPTSPMKWWYWKDVIIDPH